MNSNPNTIGDRIADLAKDLVEHISSEVDVEKLSTSREYLMDFANNFVEPLVVSKARQADPEDIILEIYFQIDPNATPQLTELEYCAGVCLENTGGWVVREHNLTHIRDIKEENVFLKWWYFETIRVNVPGWTKMYFDSYLEHEVISYTSPVWADPNHFIGVLGIDIDYSEFVARISKRLVDNIRSDIQKLKEGYRSIGIDPDLENQYVNTYTNGFVKDNAIKNDTDVNEDKMASVNFLIEKAAISDISVLLQGETGTGKDFIAREIHDRSSRASGPFINLNCAALSENLIESELFGYTKGAFTGASSEGSGGHFAAADKGTLFLNEIGELPMHLQVKLLNVIQDKEITRVGSTKKSKVDFRLIVASNRDLAEMVRNNMFRKDLYFRINTLTINIPPLRERVQEIPHLTALFLSRNNEKYKTNKTISESLMKFFAECQWPGNIRELENIIERIVLTSSENCIEISDLPTDFLCFSGCSAEPLDLAHMPVSNPDISHEAYESAFSPASSENLLKQKMEKTEKEIIMEAYNRLGSSYKVAEELGISQSQAYKKIKKYFSNEKSSN